VSIPPSASRFESDWLEPLTALDDDRRAEAVFDWLIAHPATKRPGPNGKN